MKYMHDILLKLDTTDKIFVVKSCIKHTQSITSAYTQCL